LSSSLGWKKYLQISALKAYFDFQDAAMTRQIYTQTFAGSALRRDSEQVARIERQRNPGSTVRLTPDFVSLNPGYTLQAVLQRAINTLPGRF